MVHTDRAVRVGGAWIAVASFLMVIVLALHGPIAHDLDIQMARIADAADRWAVVHWIAATALSLYAVSALILLTSHSRLTDGGGLLSAWAVICIGSLWTTITAVVETTVVAQAAASGSDETFAAWWAFAEGMGSGVAFFALAFATIAANEARAPARAVPAWSGWIGMLAGIASFGGWALGMWLGVAVGNLLWVAATMVLVLWTLWFGVALARAPVASTAASSPSPAYSLG